LAIVKRHYSNLKINLKISNKLPFYTIYKIIINKVKENIDKSKDQIQNNYSKLTIFNLIESGITQISR